MGVPFGIYRVTLYHKTGTGSIEKHILSGCSWRSVRERTLRDVSMQSKTGTACICRYGPGQQKCAQGDVLVLGVVADSAASISDLATILDKYRPTCGAFMVETFTDNSLAGPMLRHYCAKGE